MEVTFLDRLCFNDIFVSDVYHYSSLKYSKMYFLFATSSGSFIKEVLVIFANSTLKILKDYKFYFE